MGLVEVFVSAVLALNAIHKQMSMEVFNYERVALTRFMKYFRDSCVQTLVTYHK